MVTFEQLKSDLNDRVNRPVLDANGVPIKSSKPPYKVKMMSPNTVASLLSRLNNMQKFFNGDMSKARDIFQVFAWFRDAGNKMNIVAQRVSAYRSFGKYSPDFKRYVGENALNKAGEFLSSISESIEEDAVDRTEDKGFTEPSAEELRRGADLIERFYGRGSRSHLAAVLHLECIGVRDDLQSVIIVNQDEGQEGNYYAIATGDLWIQEHKTAAQHGPYHFRLSKAIREMIEASLDDQPRAHLLWGSPLSPVLKKAYAQVGIKITGTNSFRHAFITEMIKNNPSAKNVARVAKIFKHSPDMTMKYFRNIN